MKSLPKRVLFVDHCMESTGGAEESLLLLLAHLDRKRFQPYLAGVEGDLLQKANKLGVTTFPVKLLRLRGKMGATRRWLSGSREVGFIASRIGADILHGNTVRAAFYTCLAAKLARKKFVWHMRDFWLTEEQPPCKMIDAFFKQVLLLCSDLVLVNSKAVGGNLPLSKKVRVIHNGIDLSLYNCEITAESFRLRYGVADKAPLVGMVGRLRPWKGQKRFLDMAALLLKKIPDCFFLIVGGAATGNDEYFRRLRNQVDRLGLRERVIFTGHLDDVRPPLAAMDVFVHPGDPEPFGLVNIQAMAMARPVVAFAHGALPELINDGENGKLIQAGDVGGMVEAIAALLKNKSLRQTMGAKGRLEVEKKFIVERVTRQVEKSYLKIL